MKNKKFKYIKTVKDFVARVNFFKSQMENYFFFEIF